MSLDEKLHLQSILTVIEFHCVTFSDFIFFWAIMFVVTTTLVLLFKREVDTDDIENNNERKLSIKETYGYLWKIIRMRPIQEIALFLFTWQVSSEPMLLLFHDTWCLLFIGDLRPPPLGDCW